MKRKTFTPEQIIGKLREAEVLLGQGQTVGAVSRKLEVTEQTYQTGVRPRRGTNSPELSSTAWLLWASNASLFGPWTVWAQGISTPTGNSDKTLLDTR